VLRRAVICCLLLLACTPLVRPGQDAGTGGGTGGGGSGGGAGGGSGGPWVEVPIAITGAQGDVQRLAARPGEVWAMVGHGAMVRATTGRFELLWDATPPNLLDFALTPAGQVAVLTDGALLACTSACEAFASYADFALPAHPLAVCSGGEALEFLVGLGDGGTTLFAFDGAGWNRTDDVPVKDARQCAVDTAGRIYVGGRGAVGIDADGGVSLVMPATGALSRPPESELWTLVAAESVGFAASAQGAGARGDAWSALPALSGSAAALAVRSPTQAFVFGTSSAARFDGTAWRPDVAPATLTTITAAAYGPDGALYVGGSDATGAPRVFRRAP